MVFRVALLPFLQYNIPVEFQLDPERAREVKHHVYVDDFAPLSGVEGDLPQMERQTTSEYRIKCEVKRQRKMINLTFHLNIDLAIFSTHVSWKFA